MAYISINGKATAAELAAVSVQDRGFRYGDGVFETLRVHAGAPYRFDWHMERLARGLSSLRIAADLLPLAAQCRELITLNEVEHGLLRIQITRGIGGRGYLPGPSTPTIVIETMGLPEIPKEPVSLWLSSLERISPRALPVHMKLCQGVNSTLARMDAADHGCFDALQLNHDGMVCETSSANIFWLKDGTLFTPALACGALEGSVRAAMFELSPYPVQETFAPPDALKDAEAVCITNSAWGVLPVNELQPAGGRWQSELLAQRLQILLADDMEGAAR